ncbi:Ubiquinone biosynthesis protein [Thecaphora frezii]
MHSLAIPSASHAALRSVGPRSAVATSSRVRLAPAPSSAPVAATRALSTSNSTPTPRPSTARPLDQVEHRHTSPLAKLLLTAGSALGLLNNPSRGDLLSILTQVSSPPALPHLLALMRSTESGRRLLVERPSINSETVDVEYLSQLKRGQFGREWIEWLRENCVGPDGRAEADYMPTPEQKYLIQRYRESHDFYHLLLRMPVTQLGETVVKYFEVAQMAMPVAGLAALGGTLRMLGNGLAALPRPSQLVRLRSHHDAAQALEETRSSLPLQELAMLRTLAPWATEVGRTASPLIGVEWEKYWERDINEMRQELGIPRPPIEVPKFAGRKTKTGKRRGWPSKILEAQRAKEAQQQQQQEAATPR